MRHTYTYVNKNLRWQSTEGCLCCTTPFQGWQEDWEAACTRCFLWGVASLLEAKIRNLCAVQLCAKYRLVSATSSPYHKCRKIKRTASFKMKGLLYICLLIAHLLTLVSNLYIWFPCPAHCLPPEGKERSHSWKKYLGKSQARSNLTTFRPPCLALYPLTQV